MLLSRKYRKIWETRITYQLITHREVKRGDTHDDDMDRKIVQNMNWGRVTIEITLFCGGVSAQEDSAFVTTFPPYTTEMNKVFCSLRRATVWNSSTPVQG